jgi:excinuclease ABC subunit A
VIVIEHNLHVIKSADWLIDLGPEGGRRGGFLCAAGTPEEVASRDDNQTGRFLRRVLSQPVPVGGNGHSPADGETPADVAESAAVRRQENGVSDTASEPTPQTRESSGEASPRDASPADC